MDRSYIGRKWKDIYTFQYYQFSMNTRVMNYECDSIRLIAFNDRLENFINPLLEHVIVPLCLLTSHALEAQHVQHLRFQQTLQYSILHLVPACNSGTTSCRCFKN